MIHELDPQVNALLGILKGTVKVGHTEKIENCPHPACRLEMRLRELATPTNREGK